MARGQTIREILRGPGEDNYGNCGRGDYRRQAEAVPDGGGVNACLREDDDDDARGQKLILYRTASRPEVPAASRRRAPPLPGITPCPKPQGPMTTLL